MATATTTSFAKFKILIGDGETPTEGFTPICGLTSKGVQWSADVVTSEVPDCADEDLPSWQEKDVKSVGASISGSGMWSVQSHGQMLDWMVSGAKKNIKIQYVDAATGEPEFYNGPAVITGVGHSVEKGGRLSQDISIEFTAKPTIVNAI